MQVQAYKGSVRQGLFLPFDGTIVPDSDEVVLTIVKKSTIQQEQKPKMSREEMFGCMRGEFKMSDDFDAPLDCFKEYIP